MIENVTSDFGYCGYYKHNRSGLNLTLTRPYSSTFGRWLNRDPLSSNSGNSYMYVGNGPSMGTDPTGLLSMSELTKALTSLCNCPTCNVHDKESCVNAAQDIASAIGDVWSWPTSHTGDWIDKKTRQPLPETINGYYCWDFARNFYEQGSLKSNGMFTLRYRHFNKIGSLTTHFGVTIAINTTEVSNCKCQLSVDDGYLSGGEVHEGCWGPPAGWKEDTADPNPEWYNIKSGYTQIMH